MTLLEALMHQGHSRKEALEIMDSMVEAVHDGADPEEVLYLEGLEPDYVIDLINWAI